MFFVYELRLIGRTEKYSLFVRIFIIFPEFWFNYLPYIYPVVVVFGDRGGARGSLFKFPRRQQHTAASTASVGRGGLRHKTGHHRPWWFSDKHHRQG